MGFSPDLIAPSRKRKHPHWWDCQWCDVGSHPAGYCFCEDCFIEYKELGIRIARGDKFASPDVAIARYGELRRQWRRARATEYSLSLDDPLVLRESKALGVTPVEYRASQDVADGAKPRRLTVTPWPYPVTSEAFLTTATNATTFTTYYTNGTPMPPPRPGQYQVRDDDFVIREDV